MCLLQQSSLLTAACPLILQGSQRPAERENDLWLLLLTTTSAELGPQSCKNEHPAPSQDGAWTRWCLWRAIWQRPAELLQTSFDCHQVQHLPQLIICCALPYLSFSVICTNNWWEYSKSLLGKLIVYLRGSTYEMWYPGRDPGISSSSKMYPHVDIQAMDIWQAMGLPISFLKCH